MNLRLLIILCVVQVFTSCNEENIEAARRTTIVDLICQEPDFTIFCELLHLSSDLDNDTIPDIIWRLEYAGVEFYDSVANQFCASNVETVFVPNDSSLIAFFG